MSTARLRRCLVVIPLCKSVQYMFGFSAPLAWLFAGRAAQVSGVYGHQLSDGMIRGHDDFIVELNWFTELFEFGMLVEHIKRVNPRARILFGGLYAQLVYRTVFERYPVDGFIRGDNELPLRLYLDGEAPESVPNLVTRDREPDIEYRFSAGEFAGLEFDLDWFPDYADHLARYPTIDNQQYRMPMIITSRGGCAAPHAGCEYCMGSRRKQLRSLYGRPVLAMDNDSLIALIGKAARFGSFCLYVTSPCTYDLSSVRCDARVFIEIDSPVDADRLARIMPAFRRCEVLIPVHGDGIMGGAIRESCQDILALCDRDHQVRFAAYRHEEAALAHLPADMVVYLLDTFVPEWGHFDVYSRWDQALAISKERFGWILWQLDQHGIAPRNKLYLKSFAGPLIGDHPGLRRAGALMPVASTNRKES